MIELIIFCSVVAVFVNGVHIVFTPGNILERVGLFFETHIGEFWSKPLFTCPTCMGGIYTILAFPLYFGGYDIRLLAAVPVTICLATLISTVIDIVSVLRDIEDKFPKEKVRKRK